MIGEFEQGLADVLGARLAAPFTGRVSVAPGADSTETRIVLGARRSERVDPDFGVSRPVVVPGSEDHRRVVHLRCEVSLVVRPGVDAQRDELVRLRDAALYELEAPDFQSGSALAGDGDLGFLIRQMRVVDSEAPLDPVVPEEAPVALQLAAEGWFWPVDVAGETGIAIGEIRLRGAFLPLEVSPAVPEATVGGDPVDLKLRFRRHGTMRLHDTAEAAPPLPFGSIAVALVDPGGRPGAGTLLGGAAGNEEGVRLLELVDEAASVRYAPPAERATDVLVAALENGAGGLGVEVGRLRIRLREG